MCNVYHFSSTNNLSTQCGRKVRLRRVTFDVFAQFSRFHTISVLLNF